METSLNQNQLEAVNHTEGPLLILAGAGSGKTRVLTYRVAHLINNGVKPYNILAITFTNKAADEMRKRVDQTTNNMGSDVWVSTFHSLCVRILRKNIDKLGFANNFTIYDTDDQKQVIKRIIKNLNLDPKQWKEKSAIAKISNAKEQMINEIEYENSAGSNFPNQIYAKIYKAYQLELKNNNALDFDDLLSKTVELFNKFPEVLEKYQDRFKYIMVDEYQDTNGVQFLLVKQLASKYNNICVVGDDDQSIYKFRGADIRNILDFEKFFPDTYVIKLEDNYRSTSYILNAANGVISNNSKRKSKTLRASRGSGDLVSFNWYNTAEEEASDIVDEIVRSVARNKLVYSDNAILYRTNAQSRLFEEELVRQNIPYRLIGGINFYSRKEIKDILAYLKTIENGSDNISLRRIINIPKRGIGNTTIEKILEIGNEYNQSMWETLLNSDNIISLARAKSKLAEFTELIKDMKKNASNSNSVLSIIDMVLDKTGYIKELEMENTDESRARIENIQEFRNKASLFDKQAETDSSNLLTQFLEEVALIADIDTLNNSENRVVLMTLHGSKGLEFPNVYMTGMEEEIFPSYISINSDNEDDIEEERRLCYVGITRAMNHLNLSGARNRFIHGRSCYTVLSRFVQEIPKECLESPSAVEEATSDFVDDEDTYGYTEKPYNKFNFKNNYYKPHNNSYGSFGSYDIDDNDTNISYNKNLENNAFINKGSSFTKADVDELDYNVGDRVSHKKFGEGIVSLIEEGARDYKVTIEFDNGETRTMLAGFARLEKID